MLRKSSFLALAIALASLGTTATTAKAVDLCFSYQGGGSIVAKGFKVPRRNRCTPFNGFQVVGGGGFTGVGCTSADGAQMILSYRLQDDRRGPTGYFEAGTCRIPVSLTPGAGVGGCSGTAISAPGTAVHFVDVATIRLCNIDVPL
jgi:hypothetical protein